MERSFISRDEYLTSYELPFKLSDNFPISSGSILPVWKNVFSLAQPKTQHGCFAELSWNISLWIKKVIYFLVVVLWKSHYGPDALHNCSELHKWLSPVVQCTQSSPESHVIMCRQWEIIPHREIDPWGKWWHQHKAVAARMHAIYLLSVSYKGTFETCWWVSFSLKFRLKQFSDLKWNPAGVPIP